jgi:probable rRNA maturation factor
LIETPETGPIAVETTIEAGDWGDEAALLAEVDRILAAALDVGRFDVPKYAELSLVLTDDAHIRDLNRTWRGQDKATNVLSFPAGESPEPDVSDDYSDQPMLLGDIVIARETLVREAAEEEKSVADHFRHLLVHGFMHLMGYDHEEDDEAEEMEAIERAILATLGVKDPYAD